MPIPNDSPAPLPFPEPDRPLTSRQCAGIIGSLLGGLLNMAPPEIVYQGLEYTRSQFPKLCEAIRAMRGSLEPAEEAKGKIHLDG